MTALDYARDDETAALIYDFTRAQLLPDEALRRRAESLRRAQRAAGAGQGDQHTTTAGESGMGYHARRVSGGAMPLEEALAVLGAPLEWLEPLRTSGAHYAQIRRLWRGLVLASHPDKQPLGQVAAALRVKDELFTAAVSAFDTVEAVCVAGGFLDW